MVPLYRDARPIVLVMMLALVGSAGCKKGPTAMEVCRQLEATGKFNGCVTTTAFDGELCRDQAEFSFTYAVPLIGTEKQELKARGQVLVCSSDEELRRTRDHLSLQYGGDGQMPPWVSSEERRTIIFHGGNGGAPEKWVAAEKLNALETVLGEKATHPVRTAACQAKESCKSLGHCSVLPGKEENCLAGSDDDCRQADVCKKSGMCTRDGHYMCRQ